jgi:hypothetical protein
MLAPWLSQFVVAYYRGWTYVTLLDEVDNDYSWVAKPGIHTHEELQTPEAGNPRLGTDYVTRAEAEAAARATIDSEVGDQL